MKLASITSTGGANMGKSAKTGNHDKSVGKEPNKLVGQAQSCLNRSAALNVILEAQLTGQIESHPLLAHDERHLVYLIVTLCNESPHYSPSPIVEDVANGLAAKLSLRVTGEDKASLLPVTATY